MALADPPLSQPASPLCHLYSATLPAIPEYLLSPSSLQLSSSHNLIYKELIRFSAVVAATNVNTWTLALQDGEKLSQTSIHGGRGKRDTILHSFHKLLLCI